MSYTMAKRKKARRRRAAKKKATKKAQAQVGRPPSPIAGEP